MRSSVFCIFVTFVMAMDHGTAADFALLEWHFVFVASYCDIFKVDDDLFLRCVFGLLSILFILICHFDII